MACYFAAQALDGSQDTTLVWTVLFLAVLAAGEVGLDVYQDRRRRAWYLLAAFLGGFIFVLGVLRFLYLATVGTNDPVTAAAGAGLFTAATAGFVFLGYRALRAAETPQAWRARRRARAAYRVAQAARESADREAVRRDQLIDAYLMQVRRVALRTCPAEQLLLVEAAARKHLTGEVTKVPRSTRIASASAGALLICLSGCGYLSAPHPVRAGNADLAGRPILLC